jgi:hypothetical protein
VSRIKRKLDLFLRANLFWLASSKSSPMDTALSPCSTISLSFYSRLKNSNTRKSPSRSLPHRTVIDDGFVAIDNDGRPDFNLRFICALTDQNGHRTANIRRSSAIQLLGLKISKPAESRATLTSSCGGRSTGSFAIIFAA